MPTRTLCFLSLFLYACTQGEASVHARVMESPVLQARVVYTSVEAIRAWVEFWPDGGPRS